VALLSHDGISALLFRLRLLLHLLNIIINQLRHKNDTCKPSPLGVTPHFTFAPSETVDYLLDPSAVLCSDSI
jgi:hypothetical protein